MREFEILLEIVETVTEITREELTSKRRFRHLVEMRMICARILKESETNFTLEYIGSLLNIDHATVLHYYKTHENLMKPNKEHIKYQKNFNLIRDLYQSKALRESGVKLLLIHKKTLLEKELEEINKKLAYIEEKQASEAEVELTIT